MSNDQQDRPSTSGRGKAPVPSNNKDLASTSSPYPSPALTGDYAPSTTTEHLGLSLVSSTNYIMSFEPDIMGHNFTQDGGEGGGTSDDYDDDGTQSSEADSFSSRDYVPNLKKMIISTEFGRSLARAEDLVVYNSGKISGNLAIGTLKRYNETVHIEADDPVGRVTGGRVVRVRNIFKDRSEKRLIEETCLLYRHLVKSDSVLRFRNKYSDDPVKRRMRIADMTNMTGDVGIVIDTKATADVLVLPEKTRVVKNVPINQEKTIEFINFFTSSNFIYYNGWFGNMKEMDQDIVVSLVYGSETYRVTFNLTSNSRYDIEMIRSGADNGKAFYVGESVKIYLADLMGKRATWERAAPYRLVAKRRRCRDAQCNCIIEEIRTKAIIVDWITSPSLTPRPDDRLEHDLDKIKRVNLTLPPQYVAHDRLEFTSQGIEPHQLTTLKEWKVAFKQEFMAKFEKATDFLAPRPASGSRKSKSRDNTPMDTENHLEELTEPNAKNMKLDEEAMRELKEEKDEKQSEIENVAMEENDQNLEAEGVTEEEEIEIEEEKKSSPKKRKVIKKKRGAFYSRKARKRKESAHVGVKEMQSESVESVADLIGHNFIGEILRPYQLCDLQMLDGTIVRDVPCHELQIYELDLDQMDHVPGVLVIRKDEKNPDDVFGLMMRVDAEERSCLVRWFERRGVDECVQTKDEECTLFDIMKHTVYHRDLIGHLAVSLKDNFASSNQDVQICQIIENCDDGRQRVRFFDGSEDLLWPFQMTAINLEDAEFDVDEEGPSLLTALSINGSTSRDTFNFSFDNFLSTVDESNKGRFELYRDMINRFVRRSSPSYFSHDPKEYALGFVFKLIAKEIERTYSEPPIEVETELPNNYLCSVAQLLLNSLIDITPEAIQKIFSMFIFLAKIPGSENQNFPDLFAAYKKNPDSIALPPGVTFDEAKLQLEIGDELYAHITRLCTKVVTDKKAIQVLESKSKYLTAEKFASSVWPFIYYIALRFHFDTQQFKADPNTTDDPQMRFAAVSLRQIYLNGIFDPAFLEVEHELYLAIEKQLKESTGAGDEPTTSKAEEGGKVKAAKLLKGLLEPELSEFCKENSTLCDTQRYVAKLSVLERILDEAETGNVRSVVERLCELPLQHTNADTLKCNDAIPPEPIVTNLKECTTAQRFSDTLSSYYKLQHSNRDTSIFTLEHATLGCLVKLGLIDVKELNLEKIIESLRPQNFFNKEDERKEVIEALLDLYGRRLFDVVYVLSMILGKIAEPTANAAFEVFREAQKQELLHPVIYRSQVLACLKSRVPAIVEEIKKSMLTTVPKSSMLGGSFEVLDTCTEHTFLAKSGLAPLGLSKALAREYKLLADLPDGIHVRAFSDRIDLLTVVICGPADTPFDTTPFLIDLWMPPNYPYEPPKAHYVANSREQLNPNLYQEGKICTSLLGTWDGVGSERWNPHKSNLLQVVLSIQALILVRDPFFNEAGYESRRGEPDALDHSRRYNEVAAVNAMEYLIKSYERPRACVADVIREHIKREFPQLRKRLLKIANGEMPKYDVMMSKGFRMAVQSMLNRMDEVIGPVEQNSEIATSAATIEEGGNVKQANDDDVKMEEEEHAGKTADEHENLVLLVLNKHACPGDSSHVAHNYVDVQLKTLEKEDK